MANYYVMEISEDIYIEELVEKLPKSVEYLSKKGIRCIICGEPVCGTLRDAAKEKGFDDEAVKGFVNDLNELAEGRYLG